MAHREQTLGHRAKSAGELKSNLTSAFCWCTFDKEKSVYVINEIMIKY